MVPPAAGFQTVVFDYATWATRAGGYIIDSLIVLAFVIVLGVIFAVAGGALLGISPHGSPSGLSELQGMGCCMIMGLFGLATFAIGLYNKVYLVAQRGASIGQGVVKVKVVNAQGQLLTMGAAFVRLLVQIAIGFVPFGSIIDLLWPLWDERRQTLHDKAVGCYVINNPPRY